MVLVHARNPRRQKQVDLIVRDQPGLQHGRAMVTYKKPVSKQNKTNKKTQQKRKQDAAQSLLIFKMLKIVSGLSACVHMADVSPAAC